MKAIMAILMLFAGVVSCVPASTDVVPLNGTYIGYFHQSGKDTARVTLNFTDNTFDGSSNKDDYPAITQGRFKQSSSILTFLTPLAPAGHNDYSLVLAGDYNYLYNDDGTIRIWKEGNNAQDEFILKAYEGETVMGNDAGIHQSDNSTFQ